MVDCGDRDAAAGAVDTDCGRHDRRGRRGNALDAARAAQRCAAHAEAEILGTCASLRLRVRRLKCGAVADHRCSTRTMMIVMRSVVMKTFSRPLRKQGRAGKSVQQRQSRHLTSKWGRTHQGPPLDSGVTTKWGTTTATGESGVFLNSCADDSFSFGLQGKQHGCVGVVWTRILVDAGPSSCRELLEAHGGGWRRSCRALTAI